MKNNNIIFFILVLIFWSTSSTLVSVFTQNCNPIVVAGFVNIISAVFLSFLMLNKKNYDLLKNVELKELLKLSIPAILGLFLYPISYFVGISSSSPIKANVLNYLWPLIAYVMSNIINHRKFKIIEIISIILATIGGYIVLCSNDNIDLKNILFNTNHSFIALLGAIFYGVYTALIEKFIPILKDVNRRYNKTSVMNNQLPAHLRMYVMVLITLIFYIPIFLFYVLFHREVFISTVNVFYHNNIALISLLLYSIINYSIAHLLWNKLNNKNNIVLTASAAFLIPLFSTLILSFSVKNILVSLHQLD